MENGRSGRPMLQAWGKSSGFISGRRRHTRYWRDWSSDVCSSDLAAFARDVARRVDDHRRPPRDGGCHRAGSGDRQRRRGGAPRGQGRGGEEAAGRRKEIGRASCRASGWRTGGAAGLCCRRGERAAALFQGEDGIRDIGVTGVQTCALPILRRLRAMSLDVWMITGDRRETADAIAREAGIDNVVAEALPEGKVAAVKKLQAAGKRSEERRVGQADGERAERQAYVAGVGKEQRLYFREKTAYEILA